MAKKKRELKNPGFFEPVFNYVAPGLEALGVKPMWVGFERVDSRGYSVKPQTRDFERYFKEEFGELTEDDAIQRKPRIGEYALRFAAACLAASTAVLSQTPHYSDRLAMRHAIGHEYAGTREARGTETAQNGVTGNMIMSEEPKRPMISVLTSQEPQEKRINTLSSNNE